MNEGLDVEPSFDVYLSGELLEGHSRESVAESIARLFKVEMAAAQKLLDGQRHRVKSDCSKAAALQYRKALTDIGAAVSVVRHGSAPPSGHATAEETVSASAPATGVSPQAPAEKAVFGAQDAHTPHPGSTATPGTAEQGQHIAHATNRDPGKSASFEGWRPGDKPIDFKPSDEPKAGLIAELSIAPVGARMSDPDNAAPPLAVIPPDYDVAPAGEPIPNAPVHKELVNPNTEHLRLEPLKDA